MVQSGGGPWVALAVVVEKVLHERDEVLSLIRVVDRLTVELNVLGAGLEVLPEELPEGGISLTVVVALKSGDARGRHQVILVPHLPSGQILGMAKTDVLLEGEERGVNLLLQVDIPAVEGLYWFDVALDDPGQVLTRVPYRVAYQRGARRFG